MLFKVKKLYISVSMYFWVIIIWAILMGNFLEFIACLGALILHELGHIIVTYFLGEKVNIFYIIPFGFSCRLKNQSKIDKNKLLKIVLAGPATSFIVAVFSLLWTKEFAILNLIITFFNLMPIGNLDGGRIFRILMQK